MRNITLITLSLAMILIAGKSSYSQIREQLFGTIISSEDTIITNFNLNYKIYVNDTVTLDSLNFTLPNNIAINSYTNITSQQYTDGDSIMFQVNVSHTDTANLPFYPEELALNLHYTNTLSDTLCHTIFSKLYYTPYNSVEIWSISDFLSLPRRWHHPSDNPSAQRVYINPNSIPQTNMSDISTYERDSASWDDWWIDDFREITIDGLAYSVLMKPIPVDSLDYYKDYGDGDTNLKGTYTGTVSGRITANIYTGGEGTSYNDRTNIGLGGIRIRLREQDHILGQEVYGYFGEAFTNDDGTYSITYSKFQAFEGGEVELYLEIIAEDDGSDLIKSKPYGVSVIKEKKAIGNYSQNAGNITFNLQVDEDCVVGDAYPPIHFTKNVFNYFSQEGVPLSPKIRFRIGEYGCFANCYVNSFSWPAIYLSSGAGYNEETVRHEFGHVIMFKLQDNEIKIPYGETGVDDHGWSRENTGLLAWIEGWADAISMIMDAADYIEYCSNNEVNDPEYGYGGWYPNYECRIKHENASDNPINNGFRSEYFIACAIYDLWDGSGKGLPNSYILGNNDVHAYNDDANWDDENWNLPEIDDVEFSLAQICAPLQSINASNINDLRNISQYYNLFISQLSCEDRAKASKAFRQNKILWDIDDYALEVCVNGLSSDMLRTDKDKYEYGCFHHFELLNGWLNLDVLTQTWTDTYWTSTLNENSVNEYHISACQGMPFGITDNYWVGAIKDVIIRETNIYLNDQNNYCSNLPTGIFYTCGGTDIIIRNGKIELGATDGSKTAELEINDGSVLEISNALGHLVVNTGSVLRIKDGGTLKINYDGNLAVNGTGEIIIEEGGQIIYYEGSIIELNDSNSILEIAGDLHIGDDAQFTFTGNGFVKFSNTGNDATNNIFCGSGASILFSGSGQSDKVLEIDQATVRFPAMNSLTFENCKIEMASGTPGRRMLAETNYPITFNNVYLTSTGTSNNNHRSFHLYGQANVTIEDCTFENGYYGLYANCSYTAGASIYADNCNFFDNNTGLYVYNKSVHLTDCDFSDNTGYGIYCTNMSVASDLTRCNSINNGSGMYYQGSAASDVSMDYCNISSNSSYGIYTSGNLDLDMFCNNVENNNYGIYTRYGVNVKIDNNAKNKIINNNKSIYLNYGLLFANNGYNQLYSTNDDYAVYGLTPLFAICGTPTSLTANYNRWEYSYPNAYPSYNDNYKLWVYNCDPVSIVNINDLDPSYSLCKQTSKSNNPEAPDNIVSTTNEDIIVTKSGDVSNIEGQIEELSSQLCEINTETGYYDLINQYYSLILELDADIDLTTQYWQNIAYSDVHNVLSTLLDFVDNDVQNQRFVSSVNKLINLNGILSENIVTINSRYIEYKLDIALLLRMSGNYEAALDFLAELQIEIEATDYDSELTYINDWMCRISAENLANNGTLSPDEFEQAISNCGLCYSSLPSDNTIIQTIGYNNYDSEQNENSIQNINENIADKIDFSISPNPNKGDFVINISPIESEFKFKIINSLGQVVKEIIPDSQDETTFKVVGLTIGYYQVALVVEDQIIETSSVLVK